MKSYMLFSGINFMDIALTLNNWELELNPIVKNIGQKGFMIIKLLSISLFAISIIIKQK